MFPILQSDDSHNFFSVDFSKLTELTNLFKYSYSKTNKMHLFLKLFILVKHSTCSGRSFRPSSGAQNCTYSKRYMCSFELLMMDEKTV